MMHTDVCLDVSDTTITSLSRVCAQLFSSLAACASVRCLRERWGVVRDPT